MHELAITERIMQIALDHLPPGEKVCVSDVYLVLGELSSIVDDSVQFYWEIIGQNNTAVSTATLHFRRIPTQLACQNCHHTYHPAADWGCPTCGSFSVRVTAGEEFYVEAIEVIPADRLNKGVPYEQTNHH